MGKNPVSCFVYYVVMNKITLCPQDFPDTVFAPALTLQTQEQSVPLTSLVLATPVPEKNQHS